MITLNQQTEQQLQEIASQTHQSCNEFDGFRYRSTHPTTLFFQGHYQVSVLNYPAEDIMQDFQNA